MDIERLRALGEYLAIALGDPDEIWKCDGTLKQTEIWLRANGDSEDEFAYIEGEGGTCDCEVLLNVVIPKLEYHDSEEVTK